MDLRYVMGIDGSINTRNANVGADMGLKLYEKDVSMGGSIGFDCSKKQGFATTFGASVGYNSEIGFKKYSNGIFADGNVKYRLGFEDKVEHDPYGDLYYEDVKTSTEYNGEVGLRLNRYRSTHTNLSAFGQYSNIDGDIEKNYGGKYELSDGAKAMHFKLGVNEHDDSKDLFIGIGARATFGI